MCGINCSFNFSNLDIHEMNKRIAHRGNRPAKVMKMPKITLGHVRLAIQGLSTEFDQPMVFPEGKIVLFNGEIFNFKEIDPESKCDTSIIPYVGPEKWDGDFAVVIYDTNNRWLEVFTDRFGKKQLYYKLKNGRIHGISSEAKALINGESNMDKYYFGCVGRNGYCFNSNDTIADDVKRFMPGIKYFIGMNGKILKEEKIEWDSENLLYDKPKDDLNGLLDLSIQRRLISDIPVGMLFSGGLDSSIVLNSCIKHENIPEVFIVDNCDDVDFAERYCSEIGIKPIKVSLERGRKTFQEAHYAYEAGVDLGSVIPKYCLLKKVAEKGLNVCIGGSGADEVFGGYKRMLKFDYQSNDIYNELMYYHLPRLDKLSMYNTVEYRTPFTADYVIDFGLGLPYEERINKVFLRKSFKNDLPRYIYERKKEPLKSKKIFYDKKRERGKIIKYFKENFDLFRNGYYGTGKKV